MSDSFVSSDARRGTLTLPRFARSTSPRVRGEVKAAATHRSSCSASIRPGVASSVDHEVLAGYESGVVRAQERAVVAEFLGPAEALGWVSSGASAPQFVEGLGVEDR